MSIDHIKQIAVVARQHTKRVTYDTAYFNQQTLSYACAIASKILYFLLKKEGYKPVLVQGSYDFDGIVRDEINHCWIEVDHYIVDITEQQFNPKAKEISIYHIKSLNAYQLYTPGKKNKKLKGWPKEQCPKTYMKKIKKLIKEYRKSL